MIDDLESLCDEGHHEAAATLAEFALKLNDAAVGYVDDAGGEIVDIADRLIDLHYRACRLGRPDPGNLARRLLDLEVSTEVGLHRAAAAYADVLGEVGLAAYRRLIEPRWRRSKPASDCYFDGDAFDLHQAMLGWALGTGDPDALIGVHARGRMLPGDRLEICQALQAAGRGDEAIQWARRGLREHRDRQWQMGGLREFLSPPGRSAERRKRRSACSGTPSAPNHRSRPTGVSFKRLARWGATVIGRPAVRENSVRVSPTGRRGEGEGLPEPPRCWWRYCSLRAEERRLGAPVSNSAVTDRCGFLWHGRGRRPIHWTPSMSTSRRSSGTSIGRTIPAISPQSS